MTPDQFTYWLQGFAELNEAPPTAEQWQSIREHLALVFEKRTPPIDFAPRVNSPNPMEGQKVSWPYPNAVHPLPHLPAVSTC